MFVEGVQVPEAIICLQKALKSGKANGEMAGKIKDGRADGCLRP